MGRGALWALAASVATLLPGALAGQDTGGAQAADEGRAHPAVTVSVENDNWLDVNVYVVRAGARYRLGTVVSHTSATFELPAHVAYAPDLELLADPIGRRGVIRTGRLLVSPGDHVEWVVRERPSLSAWGLWPD